MFWGFSVWLSYLNLSQDPVLILTCQDSSPSAEEPAYPASWLVVPIPLEAETEHKTRRDVS